MTCERMKKCANGDYCNYHVGFLVSGCMNFKEKKPLTNEEWRKTCSEEEFAEWMAQYCCDVNTSDVREILKNEWLAWLKQPHTKELKMRTIKEIALELLNKYCEAEETHIWERSGDIDGDLAELNELVVKYKDEIEHATTE